MELNVKTITAENSRWIADSQILVEGILDIPDGLAPIQTVLEVSGTSEVTETHREENRLHLQGVAYFKILYLDTEGEFAGFDAESPFSQTFDLSDPAPNAQFLAWSALDEISCHPADGRSLSIKAVVCVDLCIAGNQNYQVLDGDIHEKYLQLKEQQVSLSRISCMNSSQCYVSTQVRVPQSMPAVKRILSERGYALLRKTVVENGRAALEGDLKIFIIYESTDKNAPLQYFEETLPFGEVLREDALREGDSVFAIANLQTLATEPDAEDMDILNISAAIGLCLIGRRQEEVQIIEDLYDEKSDVTLEYTRIGSCNISEGTCMKKILRLSADIPDSAPEISRILFSGAYPGILSTKEENGVLSMDGVMTLTLCYTTSQSGIRSVTLQLPFETEVSYESRLADSERLIRCFGEYALCEGSGREIEIKCCLDLCIWEVQTQETEAVSSATFQEMASPKQCGIMIYYANGEETLWDIAKKFQVSPDTICNAPQEGIIPKGQKLILISR